MTTLHTTPPADTDRLSDEQLAQASLDELLALARSRHNVTYEAVKVDDVELELLQLADMDDYIDRLLADLPPNTPLELPFWAKIWRTSFLMGYVLGRMPAQGRSLLEIGAGVGLCGLVAAAKGFDVTLTDVHPDALLFARINALHNNLGQVRVRYADFTSTRLGETYQIIAGSEVLYKDEFYRPLLRFLDAHLAPAPSEIVLGREYSRKAKKFYKLAERDFAIAEKNIGFKGGDDDSEKHLVRITRLTRQRHA